MVASRLTRHVPTATPNGSARKKPQVADAPAGVLEHDDDPHRLARLYLAQYQTPDGLTLRSWQSEFYRWAGGVYRRVTDGDMRSAITTFARAQLEADARLRMAARQDGGEKGKGGPPKVCKVTRDLVANVLQALAGMCHVPTSVTAPAWLDGETGPDPAGLIPAPNGVGILDRLAAGKPDAILPPTPKLFNLSRLGFPIDPTAPEPREWLAFLDTVWPNDPDSVSCLGEWLGYLVAGDRSQEKILLLVGPPRSGKGTILSVAKGLLGEGNVASPSLSGLGTDFGMQGLIGKSLAMVEDARLSGRSDLDVITERLLTISGGGEIEINRKYKDPYNGALPTRFAIATNELPKFKDASGAIASRFGILQFTESFLGREDVGLKGRLAAELTGIFLWAVRGWKRLQARGRFTEPEASAQAAEEMADLSSPVKEFVRDRCRVGPDCCVAKAQLYDAWVQWCASRGVKDTGTDAVFGRNLRAAYPKVKGGKRRIGGGSVNVHVGVGLRNPDDRDDQEAASDPVPAPRSGSAPSALLATPQPQPVVQQGTPWGAPSAPSISGPFAVGDSVDVSPQGQEIENCQERPEHPGAPGPDGDRDEHQDQAPSRPSSTLIEEADPELQWLEDSSGDLDWETGPLPDDATGFAFGFNAGATS